MAMDATSYQGGRRSGQSAAAPNPSQPQLKAVPMIAKMEEAKRRLRMPFQPGGGPAPRGMREPGGGMSPGGTGGGLPRGVRVMPPSGGMDQATSGPSGPPTTGGEMPLPPGAELNAGPRVEDDPYSMLPPRMRETARAAGRDPQEAVASRMATDPNFRQQIIQQYGPGAPGGQPAGGPTVSTGGPDMSVAGPGGMSPGSPGPGLPPPGAEPGGQVPPQIALQQRLQGMRQGSFNPGSLADLYGSFTGRGGPPQYGGSGGPNPFGFGQMGAYRG